MTTWICSDGEHSEEIEADSEREAAEDYVYGTDVGDSHTTVWITVYVRHADSEDYDWSDTIAVHPDAPACESDSGHSWVAPPELVGGLEENPGVSGHGGGVLIHTVCEHCGTLRVEDTWAQDPCTGQQGLESVCYEAGKYADWVQDREQAE